MNNQDSSNKYRQIEEHYSSSDLTKSIFEALSKAGKDIDNLKARDLKAIDEFHVRGKLATIELAEKIGLDNNIIVLDVGSGIGGPSRFLALNYKCHVTGIDLTEDYCKTATTLANKLGLDNLLDYHYGNALDLPFESDSFDVVWSQHAAMNIENKSLLYSEMSRVLKPGGKLAIYDIIEGNGSAVTFPVPWSKVQELSFLASETQMRSLLETAGFEIKSWHDSTQFGLDWWLETKAKETGRPAVGINLLLGGQFETMMSNMIKNLKEGKIKLLEIVATLTR